jgi:hypothetical protein
MKKLFLFFIMLIICGWGSAQEIARDPFMPQLPPKPIFVDTTQSVKIPVKPTEVVVTPPQITIEGVIWGTDKPMVIIDGDVYQAGETLKKDNGIKIDSIDKNIVLINYNNAIFKMTPRKKEAK